MDIAKFKQKCPLHPDYKIEFLQVDNLTANKKHQKLFYCYGCIDLDSNFKHQNYQLIKQIINSGTDYWLSKWPPVNDDRILNQLIQISKELVDNKSIVAEIEQYFTDLKRDILLQIDFCQKKMILLAYELPQNNTQILKIYQKLSKINELRSVLLNKKADFHEKESEYRVFLEDILKQKKDISEQLTSLVDQYNKPNKFNYQSALQMKEQILNSISSINLFGSPIESIYYNKKQLDVQLFTANYQDGHLYTEVSKNQNNQYQFVIKQVHDQSANTISNIILQNEVKYVFRIQIQMNNEGDICYIGLIQDKNINSQHGSKDNLNFILQQKNKFIQKFPSVNNGINKLIKGNVFQLSQENEIEIRICLKDQILEILDYPHYMSKLSLEEQNKSDLINKKDLRLYLGMYALNDSMILKDTFIVDKFE